MKNIFLILLLPVAIAVTSCNPFDPDTVTVIEYVTNVEPIHVTNLVSYTSSYQSPTRINASHYSHREGYVSVYHSMFSEDNIDVVYESVIEWRTGSAQIGHNNVNTYIQENGVLCIPDPQTNIFFDDYLMLTVSYKREEVTVYYE